MRITKFLKKKECMPQTLYGWLLSTYFFLINVHFLWVQAYLFFCSMECGYIKINKNNGFVGGYSFPFYLLHIFIVSLLLLLLSEHYFSLLSKKKKNIYSHT